MKRSTALMLFTLFDILAIAIGYFVAYLPLKEVITAISDQAEFIRYNTTFFIAFCFVVIPVIHLVGIVETFLPRYFNKSICTKVILGSLIFPLLMGLGTSMWIKNEIVRTGYYSCESADVNRKLLQIRVYVLENETCHRLTVENDKRKILGAR